MLPTRLSCFKLFSNVESSHASLSLARCKCFLEVLGRDLALTSSSGSSLPVKTFRISPKTWLETTVSTDAFNCLNRLIGNNRLVWKCPLKSWETLSVARTPEACGVLSLILAESKILSLLVWLFMGILWCLRSICFQQDSLVSNFSRTLRVVMRACRLQGANAF